MPGFARTVYRLQEAALRRPTFAYLAELERSQWLPRAELEALQARKLNRLLQTALVHSPWHAQRIRAAGLAEQVAVGEVALADLARLPTMDKADARRNVDGLVWHGVPGGAFRYNTGGSSGEPLIFYYGRERQASDAAGRMRARRWWGVEVGEREVYLWGAPVELNKTDRIKTLRDRLLNQLVLNAFEMSPKRMDQYAEAIEAYHPKCIYGYASSVALLAAHVEARGKKLRLPSLRVVCVTGEPLYPYQRELIGRVFGAPVANEFGSRDVGYTSHEAPCGQLLLMSESIILEVLDREGRQVNDGEPGEAVMTGLCSEAQPFIRYRTGDTVCMSAEPNRQGRGLHVLAEVAGRSTDFLVRPDGTIMHALAGIYVLRAVAGVAEFKIIQHSLRDLDVLVVPNDRWEDSMRAIIEAGLRSRMGHQVRIAVRVTDHIPPEGSGKYRYVISRVTTPVSAIVGPDAVAE